MIKHIFYKKREDGAKLYKTYSDQNKYIIQNETGNKYTQAIDVFPLKYTYTESEEYIERR